eukprot:1189732-Prorocentrum_minimum.AAC.9
MEACFATDLLVHSAVATRVNPSSKVMMKRTAASEQTGLKGGLFARVHSPRDGRQGGQEHR